MKRHTAKRKPAEVRPKASDPEFNLMIRYEAARVDAPYRKAIERARVIFHQKECDRAPNWQEQIKTINDTRVGPLPGLLTYLMLKIAGHIPGRLDQREVEFWEFLYQHGADVKHLEISMATLPLYIVNAKNIHALRWYVENRRLPFIECGGAQNPYQPGVLNTHPIQHIDHTERSEFNDYFFENMAFFCSPGETILTLAARYSCFALLKWRIEEKGDDLNRRNVRGLTPLMIAVYQGDRAMLEYLLTRQANLLVRDAKGETVFHAAMVADRLDLFMLLEQRLNQQGIDIKTILNPFAFTLLHYAILYEKMNFVTYLEPRFLINARFVDSQERNLVVFACAMDAPEYAEYFMRKYPDLSIHAVLQFGMSAVHSCIQEEAEKGMDWLINHGVDLEKRDAKGETPLLSAARFQKFKAVAYLVERTNVNTHALDEQQNHVGHYLATYNQDQLVKKLLNQGRLNLMQCNDEGLTMLDIALSLRKTETVKVCLDYVREFNKKRKKSERVVFKHLKLLFCLLDFIHSDILNEFGPWVEEGHAPLHMGCLCLAREPFAYLITHLKLDVNQYNQQGESALCLMIKQKRTDDVIWFFEQFRPKLTRLDSLQSSLLHLACDYQVYSLVQWAVKRGLSIVKARSDGLNALDIAFIKRDHVILSFLWTQLTETERELTIRSLTQDADQSDLNYLIEHQIYTPRDKTPELVIASEIMTTTDSHTGFGSETVSDHCSELDSPFKPLTLFEGDREELFKAISGRQVEVIKSLKHQEAYYGLLKFCGWEALDLAIELEHYGVLYHLLRIPIIRDQAHFHHNAVLVKACRLGLVNMVECLLRLPFVQKNMEGCAAAAYRSALKSKQADVQALLMSYPEVQSYAAQQHIQTSFNPHAAEWIPYPPCCKEDERLRVLLHRLSLRVKESLCQEAYIYGSFHYKKNPNDWDILLPNIGHDKHKANDLIARLMADEGKVDIIDPNTGEYGYKKHQAHIIPMIWQGLRIELVLIDKSYLEHAKRMDFTIGTQYFDLHTLQLKPIPEIQAAFDVKKKRINTISDPRECFLSDLSRIFRAVRLIADHGFELVGTCDWAIKDIFAQGHNPFLRMNPNKLNQQLGLLCLSSDPLRHVEVLLDLEVFSSLIECLSYRQDKVARYYMAQLMALSQVSSSRFGDTEAKIHHHSDRNPDVFFQPSPVEKQDGGVSKAAVALSAAGLK